MQSPLLHRLREMILSGELKPGQRVTESALAGRLGLSRTPIRNALPRLAADGLLMPVGQRGYAVKGFSERESLEALELRAVLEGVSARMLAESGAPPETLQSLRDILQTGDAIFAKRCLTVEDEDAYGEMNQTFHDAVVNAAKSPLLVEFIGRCNRVPFVAPEVIVFDEVGLAKAYDLLFRAHGMHHAIVDAIEQRDGARAEILFREHANHQRFSMFARRLAAEGENVHTIGARAARNSGKSSAPERKTRRGPKAGDSTIPRRGVRIPG